MAIFYNKVQRKNPSPRITDMLKEKEVARQTADETILNPKEAEIALSQLQKIMIRALQMCKRSG